MIPAYATLNPKLSCGDDSRKGTKTLSVPLIGIIRPPIAATLARMKGSSEA